MPSDAAPRTAPGVPSVRGKSRFASGTLLVASSLSTTSPASTDPVKGQLGPVNSRPTRYPAENRNWRCPVDVSSVPYRTRPASAARRSHLAAASWASAANFRRFRSSPRSSNMDSLSRSVKLLIDPLCRRRSSTPASGRFAALLAALHRRTGQNQRPDESRPRQRIDAGCEVEHHLRDLDETRHRSGRARGCERPVRRPLRSGASTEAAYRTEARRPGAKAPGAQRALSIRAIARLVKLPPHGIGNEDTPHRYAQDAPSSRRPTG